MAQSTLLKIRVTIYTIIFLFINIGLKGNNLKFFHLNTSNGLSQNTIYFIHQDKDGIFWFGTNGGLNKWDGYKITQYQHNPSNKNSLGQGRTTSILEDKNGDMWVGTLQGGISKYNSNTNDFENYDQFISRHGQKQGNNIEQIVKYKNHILVGTFGNGLYYLDLESKTFKPIQLVNENNTSLDYFIVNKMMVDQDSTLWIGHNHGVIKIPNQKLDLKKPTLNCSELLKEVNTLSIYNDSKSQVWFGTHSNGTYYLDLENNQLNKFNLGNEYDYPIIRDFTEDQYGNLWIATGGNGVVIIDNNKTIIQQHVSQLNNAYSLSSDITYRLYSDKNKNMWVGTYNGGLNYTNNHKQSFNHVRGYGGPGELTSNAILSICEVDNNEIFIGTDGNGIEIFNTKTGTFTQLEVFNQHDLSKKSVAVEMKRFGNKVYIGTYLKGLYVYDLKTNKLKNYRTGPGKYDIKSNNIWTITISKKGIIWIGTLDEGIAKFDPVKEEFHHYNSEILDHPLSNQFVFSLMNDNEDKLWIGTQNGGINILEADKSEISKYYLKDDNSGLTSNEIWKIYQDSKNRIWVATHDGGLCLFNKQHENFTVIGVKDGLSSNTVKSIIEDARGNIWVGTDMGLSKISLQGDDYSIKSYTKENGLQGNEFNINAAIINKDNYVFIGGNNGFNYFHPDSTTITDSAGPMVITDFQTFYHNDYSGKTKSEIHRINKETNTIELNHNISVIVIEYALIDYIIPELNTYSYKLEGFDKTWIKAGNERKATYTNLDAGNYTFSIEGTNSLGTISKTNASINIIIHPPFWEKAWFRVLAVIIIILFAISLYKLRMKNYQIQEKILVQKVDTRTKELVELNSILEDKNKEIQAQSEELRSKSENLIEVNTNLENSNIKVENQNTELEKHRNNLEILVKERTAELEKAKLSAEESEQLKMSFLANMSHEIRTPMNAIMGFSALLTEDDYTAEDRDMYSKQINQNSQSLLLLIDDILDLSKIEANQLTILPKEFDFVELINQTATDWNLIHDGKENDVKFLFTSKITEQQIIAKNDPRRIKQVLNNLLENAFKFTCEGTVELKTWIENEHIICSIKDSGIGIDKEDLPVIFNRFRKSDDSNSKAFRGVGLGLTISKRLSELLNSELWVESEFGKGSIFYFKLPIRNA